MLGKTSAFVVGGYLYSGNCAYVVIMGLYILQHQTTLDQLSTQRSDILVWLTLYLPYVCGVVGEKREWLVSLACSLCAAGTPSHLINCHRNVGPCFACGDRPTYACIQ